MVSFRIDREAGKLILSYPEHLGLAEEVIKLGSNRDAMGLWRLRVRSYVMNTMLSYYKNRTASLSKNMTTDKQEALNIMRKKLLANYEGKLLEKFLWQVMLLAEQVVKVAPHPLSKHFNYYHTVIIPMYVWIEQFLRCAMNSKRN